MTDVVLILLQSIADEADAAGWQHSICNITTFFGGKADRVFTGYNIPSSDLSEDMIQDAMARMIRNIDTVRSLSDAQLVGLRRQGGGILRYGLLPESLFPAAVD